ncbi:MAG: nucleotidyltransferase family protein [Pseudomonadota bacterium]|nr:NTP transferase domain-containing protein [Alteromonas sp.]MDY6927778.1 nucleotidyltransferase family protein [Pseudomonadota bacterium]RPH22294.1 MAG: D-glycero-D-manno-heptose 1-phosphate guanosyltransferase [Alteromonadaceae bacterium TMED7]|tara:strand:- start:13666 stop:14409 length:744 start_codon:yes stop_codon:yes gene_type:complete
MKVIILAGGLGTRLRSVVSDVPKPLAPIRHIPYLAYMLNALYAKGLREFILSVGYKSAHFEQFIATQKSLLPELSLELVVESEPLGTGGALKFCFTSHPAERYLIFNGDSYCDFPLAELLEAASQHNMAMVVAKVDNISRYGEVTLRDNGCVEAFHEKQPVARAGLINAGVYCLPGDIFEGFQCPQSFSFEQAIMPGLMAQGVATVEAAGPFIDMGIPEDYQRLASQPDYYFPSRPRWPAAVVDTQS